MKKLFSPLLFLLCLSLVAPVLAEEAYLLTEKTYKSLSTAQQLMESEQYAEAGQRLSALLEQTDAGSYDHAVVQQTIGYLYSAQELYGKAAKAFQRALDANALPETVSHDLRFNLAQILIADGDYGQGITLMEAWLSKEAKPKNSIYVLLATAYFRVENFSKAIERINTAIKNDSDPKEDWYRLKLSAHMSLKQYKAAIGVLETIIPRYPHRKVYWDQLAALYQSQDQEFRSLAVRMLADRLDMRDADTVVNLADMYRYLRIPYKSGMLLQTAMDNGVITTDLKHMQKLADSWIAAREDKLAAETLTKILPMDNSGDSHLKLARVYVSMEAWDNAIEVLEQAKDVLPAKEQGPVLLLLGTSHYQLENLEQAKAAFTKAMSYDAESRQATQWLRHINDLLKKNNEETA